MLPALAGSQTRAARRQRESASDGPPRRSPPSPPWRWFRRGAGTIDQEDASRPYTTGGSCTPGRGRCGLHGRPRGGALVGRPRCSRIRRATVSSSTAESSSIVLPHFAQRRASMPQLRRSSAAQARRRARAGSSGPRGSLPCRATAAQARRRARAGSSGPRGSLPCRATGEGPGPCPLRRTRRIRLRQL